MTDECLLRPVRVDAMATGRSVVLARLGGRVRKVCVGA